MPLPPLSLPPSFTSKKARILSSLAVPIEQYDDLSPKGSIDVGIRDLIDEINALEGCVTTSSCAGRISVFLEGKKSRDSSSSSPPGDEVAGEGDGENVDEVVGERATTAGVGGKGGGGRWLFVSHDPVEIEIETEKVERSGWAEVLGMKREGGVALGGDLASGIKSDTRFIHFKFEPMILHIHTASLAQAQTVLSAALQAGFRESGALNLTTSSSSSSAEPATPMVGVRSMGLALESVIGYELNGAETCMVPEWQLRNLVEISNQRFVENTKRIERFRVLLREGSREGVEEVKMGDSGVWEGKEERRERKRAEGLRRAAEGKGLPASNPVPLVQE